jgi:glycerol-3-phosphate dehydrogenase (NAD(P)+)
MSEVLAASGWAAERIAALSGPNLAHEVLRGDPAAAVAASTDEARAAQWQIALSGPRFRVYSSTDIVGVELAGATKNIIAIAAGVAAGLGFGANTIAALVTRGLAEMTRLGVACGADFATYLGLAGVGDLTATCFSPLSRNRRLGELLAAGLTPAEAVARIGEVVEGATTAPVVLGLADARGVDVPITQEVVAVLRGEIMVKDAIDDLLSRGLKRETNQRQ